MLQKASKKMDEFTQNLRENMVNTEEKSPKGREFTKYCRRFEIYPPSVQSGEKKGWKDGSKVKEGDLGKELVVGKERNCFRFSF